MPATMTALGIDRLSIAERIQLLDEIWDSLRSDPARVPTTPAHLEELHRRLDEYEADPSAGSPAQEVFARLRGKA